MIPPLPFEQAEPLLVRDELVVAVAEEITRQGPLDVFHAYIAIFIVAFFVTMLATPLMRKLALANGIVDHPNDPRKAHRMPIAYMGGVAVFLGIIAGIALSYVAMDLWYHPDMQIIEMHESAFDNRPVPFSLLLGMTVIMLTGLIDDVIGLSPRFKIGGQLLAAAAMAMENIGTKVAMGVMRPIGDLVGNQDLIYYITLPFDVPMVESGVIELDLVYWVGTAIIAIFILGACNASNLVDGLDGLLSGVTAVATAGLLVIALYLAAADDGPMDSARVVLCMALLGACLGFLPHNFNPATIFLGDAGSLLLGFCVIAIVLTLGDTGRTHLVIAGLIIYSIPIIDTVLAIVRRKLAGVSMSSADDQHLHHQLKRAFGVKGAVLVLYGIGAVFAALGVWLSMGRVRVVFTIALVIASFIAVTAVKIARRESLEQQVLKAEAKRRRNGGRGGGAATEECPQEVEQV
jgi:UDP-GlcNAc:undecaprenyl-phosphate GlcNAc-1-phosphate transferase